MWLSTRLYITSHSWSIIWLIPDPHCSHSVSGVLEKEEGRTDLRLGSDRLGGGRGKSAISPNWCSSDTPSNSDTAYMIKWQRLNSSYGNVCCSSGGAEASIWSKVFQSGESQPHIWQARAFPALLRQTQPAHGVCVRNILHGKPLHHSVISSFGIQAQSEFTIILCATFGGVSWPAVALQLPLLDRIYIRDFFLA